MMGFGCFRFGFATLVCVVTATLGVTAAVAADAPGPVPATRPPPDPKAPGDPFTPRPRTGVGGVPPAPRCTITGTARSDVLRGRPNRADVLCGGAGNDRIYAGGGDVVRGGKGDDTIFARNGRTDLLMGDRGRDRAVVDRYLDKLVSVERRSQTASFSIAAARASGLAGVPTGTARGSASAPAGAGDIPNQYAFPITSTGWQRNQFVGKLVDADGGSCTGTLVAVNIVLTAAHCVYLNGSFASQPVTWTPSLWGNQRPFGSFESRDLVVLKAWQDLLAEDARVALAIDYAFVVLNPNAQGRNAGDVLRGWLGVTTEYQGVWYWSLGYAAGGWFARYGGNYPYFCLSRLEATGSEPDANGVPWYELGIGCYMTGGASGGPWLVDLNSNSTWNYVASVNSHCWPSGCPLGEGESGGYARNMWGSYFTRSVLDLLEYAKTL